MKIDLTMIDRNQFRVDQHFLPNGEVCWLVQPLSMATNWTNENKIFRSSLWSDEGDLISAGFFKFTNWGEKPEVFPVPESLDDATIVEKLDGSLLIVSKWRGEYILRTRGTSDATKLENGYELEIFKQTILPFLAHHDYDTWDFSYLFEWVSPTQKIVINYGDEPQWFLVGHVDHKDYYLSTQYTLDCIARGHNLKRPATYTFAGVEDLMKSITEWQGKEGVVVYTNNGQMLHKVKSAWYLLRHRMKSELSNIEKVMDVWLSMGRPDYKTFYNNIATQFDFELAEQCKGFISKIVDGNKEVEKIIAGMNRFIETQLKPLPTRKLQTVVNFQSYGKGNSRAAMVFKLLDGKELDNDDYKRLMFQVLK